MSDDNFSGFVRSGKSHGVSVSEHTGNAKTFRNKVSSDEHDVQGRKTAFEKQSFEDKANIQKISSDDRKGKRQSVATDNSNANRQEIVQVLGSTDNVQGVNSENLNDNKQKIDSSTTAANLQKTGNANITTNNQGVNGDAVTSNVQGIGKSNIATNKLSLPKDQVVSNNQSIQSLVNDKNRQPILNNALTTNDPKIAKLALGDNNQSVSEHAPDTNRQPLEDLASSLNMHRAPKDGAISANRQPTDKENLHDHFEVLPSETIAQAEVDFGFSGVDSGSESPDTFPKIKIKQPASAPAVERPLTAQQVAKIKHDKYLEAFHGRLAGIKRGVDALNGRLDVMEKRK